MTKRIVRRIVLGVLAALPLVASIGLCEEPPKTKPASVGTLLSFSSMHGVVGEHRDRNVCLAAKHRQRGAISLYARSSSEPRLAELCQRIDSLLAENYQLGGYLLLFDGVKSDEAHKTRVRDTFAEKEFRRLEVALSNGDAVRFGIDRETGVTIIFSDRRAITFRRDIPAGELDAAVIDELVKELKQQPR